MKTLLEHRTPDVAVTVYELPGSEGYRMTWTDYVANEWVENFPTFAVALCRVACLMDCERMDWETTFMHTAVEFTGYALDFVAKMTGDTEHPN